MKDIKTPIKNDYITRIPLCENKLEFKVITIDELKEIVKELKDKTYHDCINGRVLYDALENEECAEELLEIINESISSSIMPEQFKISTVTPIPKVTSPINPEDYRPVNNLPVIEKIIETVIHQQLKDHLNECDILCNEQSGFRAGHSTESSILTVLHDWFEAIEKKKKIVAVFLDLKRAFETVDREIMIEKLEKYGLGNDAIKWMRRYL